MTIPEASQLVHRKLFEELSVSGENADKTKHPKIFVGRFRPCDWDDLQGQLEALAAVAANDGAAVRARLKQIVPEYTPDSGALVAPSP